MSSIPEELYLEILLRVPVKTALICKCVCKTWFLLISSTDFVDLHLDRNNNRNSLMLGGFTEDGSSSSIYSISYDALVLSSITESEDDHDHDGFKLDDPFSNIAYVQLLGSCNGILCLRYCGGYEHDPEEFICLWNPATKEFKKLHRSPNEYAVDEIGLYAFGYDWKNDDYKLIIVVDFDGQKESSLVEVYMLSTDSWKSSQPVPYKFSLKLESGALVNRALHWLCETRDNNSSNVIISLDIGDEKFEELQLPEKPLEDRHLMVNVGALEGCLCVLSSVISSRFEVWVMQDYGVQNSWTRHYTITNERIIDRLYLRFMRSFEKGEILVKIRSNFVIYDPKDSTAREPKTFSSLMLYFAENYTESLVSLKSYTYVGRHN